MRRVLFDENIPRGFRRELPEYEVRTVQEEGWAGLTNGELLRTAQLKFDVFITADKRLQFQQNVTALRLAIVVISLASVTPSNIRSVMQRVNAAIDHAQPGSLTVVTTI